MAVISFIVQAPRVNLIKLTLFSKLDIFNLTGQILFIFIYWQSSVKNASKWFYEIYPKMDNNGFFSAHAENTAYKP